jgi:membrane protease subunit (stomatin/prohibitin family)
MLKSLLKGVSMGTGMGIGQELTGTLIQHVLNRGQQGQGQQNSTKGHWDIKCSGCGEISTGDSRFCGSCGKSLVERCRLSSGVKCSCGFMNANGQKFCSDCGSSLH